MWKKQSSMAYEFQGKGNCLLSILEERLSMFGFAMSYNDTHSQNAEDTSVMLSQNAVWKLPYPILKHALKRQLCMG